MLTVYTKGIEKTISMALERNDIQDIQHDMSYLAVINKTWNSVFLD